MNLTFNQSYEKMEKVTDSVYGIKKPEPNDSGFPCREEYRIIEPNLGGVGGDGMSRVGLFRILFGS